MGDVLVNMAAVIALISALVGLGFWSGILHQRVNGQDRDLQSHEDTCSERYQAIAAESRDGRAQLEQHRRETQADFRILNQKIDRLLVHSRLVSADQESD